MSGPGVLFLSESYHPVLGGAEQHLRTLAARLVAAGGRATVIARQTDPGWAREETLDGVRVRRVPPSGPGRGGKYRMVPRALRAVWSEAAAHDVIVVRGTRVLGAPALLTARTLGRPVVLQPEVNGELSGEAYTWGTALDRPWPRRLVRAAVAVRNRFFRDADAVVAMSRLIAEECREAGIGADRVRLIPHGVDTARFRPAVEEERRALRRTLALPEDAGVIVYTGRLLRGKGLDTLLDAFKGLATRRPEAHLVLVGSGAGQTLSVEDALRGRVSGEGLEARVTFPGRVDDVAPWLRASDVFAFPSVFEALGLSLLEAAACGLPAVGSRTGGIVDVIAEGRSGVLVEPSDATAMEAALEELLADPGRRAALGRGARAVAEAKFDVVDNVARYQALFAELAARRGPGMQAA